MPSFLRTLILACIFLGVTLGLVTTIAMAKTLHKHHVTHHRMHHASRGDAHLRTAQAHLIHLGYYTGKADGLMGPKTKIALKHFQRDHRLAVNGKLTPRTYSAILEADKKAPTMSMTSMDALPPVPREDFYAAHPDFYGHYDQQYTNPLQNNNPQLVPSRFGKIDVSKNPNGQNNYSVTLNGQPILNAEDQPSVIGVSQTFDLGNEDAIIVSTYRSQSAICPYKSYLLTLRSDSNKVQEIENCTNGYQASVKEDSLFIVFPEGDDGRVVGSTWRYENGDLEKL